MKSEIVLFNMSNYWDWESGVQNRNFHIYQSLLKDNDVDGILLVDVLPYTVRKTIKHYLQMRALRKNKKILWKRHGSMLYRVNEKTLVFTSMWPFFSKKKWQKHLAAALAFLAWENLSEWNYNLLSYDYWRNLLPVKKRMFDAVDNWLFHSSYKSYEKKIKENYQALLADSDVVFTVSANLKKYFEENFETKNNIFYIPNASPVELTETMEINQDLGIYQDLQKIKQDFKAILGFIGVIQEDRMDLDLLNYIAEKNPDKAIVLCGPVWKKLRKKIQLLRDRKNVFALGSVKRKDWFTVASQFDVALSPHLSGNFMDYISPTKIYEYLAVGLPVVTTRISGVADLSEKIRIADNQTDFQAAIESLLLAGKDSDLRAWSKENHIWAKRYEKMKEKLN